MIGKDKNLKLLVNSIDKVFGKNMFAFVDYWNTPDAIGLKRNSKLIYLSTLGAPKYECFYECEQFTEDPGRVYESKGMGNVHIKELTNIMSEFFEIERVK